MPRTGLKSGIPYHVAVIGAGASGTLVAAQFNKLAPMNASLAFIGSQSQPARGVAYDIAFRANLLNVPAGNMSAFPDDIEHFVRWLKEHMQGSSAATFAPRKFYGDYLTEIFEEKIRNSNKVDYFNFAATGLTRKDEKWIVELNNGASIESNSIVLALGNLMLPNDPIDFSAAGPAYYRNPWSPQIAQNLKADAPVLLIGTGLTTADVALSLREAGHRGVIHAISRHGRFYQTHKPYQPRPLKQLPESFHSPHEALRWIRTEIEKAEQEGNNWRTVIDSLRPHTSAIWNSWRHAQRASFLRHARNLWDIHRHRMSPEVADQLSGLLENRILAIHRGYLVSVNSHDRGVIVSWKSTETDELHTLNVVRIVNCTGPSRDITRIQSPLIAKLRSEGWITADPLRLGLQTDGDGRLIGINGKASSGLYTLGPLRIAGLWESIAIPEIRNQAVELAELLISQSVESSVLI